MNPSLADLLSCRSEILHTTRRLHFTKRIIRFNDEKYVLYRFPDRETARIFARVIHDATQAGAALQNIAARPENAWQDLRHGRWLAFHYEAGEEIRGKTAAPAIFSALGKTLAILHRQSSQTPRALLHGPTLDIDEEYAALASAVTAEQRQWLEESRRRLDDPGDYRLTHGDLYMKNIIVTPSGKTLLIDYELFAYAIPGVELAMLLLRHVCRAGSQRRPLLDAYLAHCDEETRRQWGIHWKDYLLAAALRMAAQRARRRRIVGRRLSTLERIAAIPMPQSLRARIAEQIVTQTKTIRSAEKAGRQYREIACRLLVLIDTAGIDDPDILIGQCFKPARQRL